MRITGAHGEMRASSHRDKIKEEAEKVPASSSRNKFQLAREKDKPVLCMPCTPCLKARVFEEYAPVHREQCAASNTGCPRPACRRGAGSVHDKVLKKVAQQEKASVGKSATEEKVHCRSCRFAVMRCVCGRCRESMSAQAVA